MLTIFAESATIIVGLVAIPILILINAFFVAAEFALVALRRSRVQELVNLGRTGAPTLLKAIDELNDSVAAAQLGITVASLALGIVSEPALHALLRPLFENLSPGWRGPVSHSLSIALTLGFVTFLHVVFGEQMPKIAALQSSERIGLMIARPLIVFTRIARPLVRAMNGTSSAFLKLLGYRPEVEDGEVHTVDELRLLIEITEDAGLLDAEQAETVRNVFALSNKKIRDIMVPWEKVAALDVTIGQEELLAKVRQGAHTRMPVYDGTPDNVVGVINTKDLFYLFSLKGVVALIDAVYEPIVMQADDSVSDALKKFKTGHRHLAIVREKEKVVGILTLEDVLEEIVGDIEDEHDKPVPKLRRAVLQRLLKRRRQKLNPKQPSPPPTSR